MVEQGKTEEQAVDEILAQQQQGKEHEKNGTQLNFAAGGAKNGDGPPAPEELGKEHEKNVTQLNFAAGGAKDADGPPPAPEELGKERAKNLAAAEEPKKTARPMKERPAEEPVRPRVVGIKNVVLFLKDCFLSCAEFHSAQEGGSSFKTSPLRYSDIYGCKGRRAFEKSWVSPYVQYPIDGLRGFQRATPHDDGTISLRRYWFRS